MKKTLTIKLGGVVFHIEDDAYHRLSQYIEGLKLKFKNDPEAEEIIQDIEERMAELFQQEIREEGNAITITMVENAINQLGSPNDIADEPTESQEQRKSSKKLYRDSYKKVFAGVCSGLSQYLNIDVTLLRIIFVILLFVTSFMFFFVYLVLWLAVPEATTTAQRMDMKGEPVNITSIEKKVKDNKQNPPKQSPRAKAQGQSKGSSAGETILKIFAWIIIGFFVFIILIVTLGLLAGLFGLTVASTVLGGFLPEVLGSGGIFAQIPHDALHHTTQSVIGLILFIGAPVILILFIISKVAFKHNGKVGWVVFLSLILWIVGISLLASSSLKFIERAANLDIEVVGKDDDGAIVVGGDTIVYYKEDYDDNFKLRLKTRKGGLAINSKDNTILFSTHLDVSDTLILALPADTYSGKERSDYYWMDMEYEIENSPKENVDVQVILYDYEYHFESFKLQDPAFKYEEDHSRIVLPDKIGFKNNYHNQSKPRVIIKVPSEMVVTFENNAEDKFTNIPEDQKQMIQSDKYYKLKDDTFYQTK